MLLQNDFVLFCFMWYISFQGIFLRHQHPAGGFLH